LAGEFGAAYLDWDNSNSIDCFGNHPTEKPCENCTTLKNQVKYLLKTCAKFTRGKANLEIFLGSQNYVFGKVGLGYNLSFKNKAKKFSSFFSKNKPNYMPFISCNYCMKKGNVIKNCYARNYDVSKGVMKWIPKGTRKV